MKAKRIVSILLTGSMLLSLLPVSALAAAPVFDAPAQTTAKKAAPLVQEADASRSTEEEAATRSSRDLDAENGTAESITTIQLNAAGKPASEGDFGNWYYSAASGCQLDTGVFALQPSSEPEAESALKARLFRIGDNAELVRGTVGCETNNYGTIFDGIFQGKVANFRTISNGTFQREVNNYGTISGGTFQADVDNNGTISGGTFQRVVFNNDTISGGSFLGDMNNWGTISGGIFLGGVQLPNHLRRHLPRDGGQHRHHLRRYLPRECVQPRHHLRRHLPRDCGEPGHHLRRLFCDQAYHAGRQRHRLCRCERSELQSLPSACKWRLV